MNLLLLVVSSLCLVASTSAQTIFTGCLQSTSIICTTTANAFEARITPEVNGTFTLVTFTGKTATTFPNNYFKGLTITNLISQSNGLTTIGDNVFTGAASIKGLSLQENGLSTITAGAFTPIASSLTSLAIINSGITPTRMNGIATGFASLNKLTDLDLKNNVLLSLSPSWFTGLTSLKNLDLSSNTIIETANVFSALSPLSASLETLTLTSNSIATVSAISSMTALKTIDLSKNQITGFSSTSPFAAAPALVEIKLSENKLTAVPNIASNPAVLNLELNSQTGSTLTTVAASAFSRNSVNNQATVNLDVNAITNYDNKAFCSAVTPNIAKVTVAWSTVGTINKCHFKQFGATATKQTNFYVTKGQGVTDVSSFCNCANVAAAKAFNVIINSVGSACESVTDASCAAVTFTDTCATDNNGAFVCPVTTSGSKVNKFDLVGFLVANVVFMFAYKQF